eukprot:gene11161-biopygen10885
MHANCVHANACRRACECVGCPHPLLIGWCGTPTALATLVHGCGAGGQGLRIPTGRAGILFGKGADVTGTSADQPSTCLRAPLVPEGPPQLPAGQGASIVFREHGTHVRRKTRQFPTPATPPLPRTRPFARMRVPHVVQPVGQRQPSRLRPCLPSAVAPLPTLSGRAPAYPQRSRPCLPSAVAPLPTLSGRAPAYPQRSRPCLPSAVALLPTLSGRGAAIAEGRRDVSRVVAGIVAGGGTRSACSVPLQTPVVAVRQISQVAAEVGIGRGCTEVPPSTDAPSRPVKQLKRGGFAALDAPFPELCCRRHMVHPATESCQAVAWNTREKQPRPRPVRVRSASVSSNSIVRPASGPRPVRVRC